jgi:hypothetical protein
VVVFQTLYSELEKVHVHPIDKGFRHKAERSRRFAWRNRIKELFIKVIIRELYFLIGIPQNFESDCVGPLRRSVDALDTIRFFVYGIRQNEAAAELLVARLTDWIPFEQRHVAPAIREQMPMYALEVWDAEARLTTAFSSSSGELLSTACWCIELRGARWLTSTYKILNKAVSNNEIRFISTVPLQFDDHGFVRPSGIWRLALQLLMMTCRMQANIKSIQFTTRRLPYTFLCIIRNHSKVCRHG